MLVRTFTRQLATTFALGLAVAAYAAEPTLRSTFAAARGAASISKQVGAAFEALVYLARLSVPTALEPPSAANPAPLPPIEPSAPCLPATAYASRDSGLPAQTTQKAIGAVKRTKAPETHQLVAPV